MQDWCKRVIVSVLVGGLLLAAPVMQAEAGEPMEKIRRTVEDVLAILANKSLQGDERRARIRQAVLQRFGFGEMAQRSLGQHWRSLTPPQRQEFVELFTDLLERSYINRIESYSPGTQNVRYVKEEVENDRASVHIEILSERDLPASVEYRLMQESGDWKVYDIVIEGVSLVNNYRNQFNSVIVKDSYPGLVKQMRLKLEQEQAGALQKG